MSHRSGGAKGNLHGIRRRKFTVQNVAAGGKEKRVTVQVKTRKTRGPFWTSLNPCEYPSGREAWGSEGRTFLLLKEENFEQYCFRSSSSYERGWGNHKHRRFLGLQSLNLGATFPGGKEKWGKAMQP